MKVFEDYAQFYDDLYENKDYLAECDYLEAVFAKYTPNKKVQTILNLGCGTGNHDAILLERGYQITGVDMSADMLKIAKKKLNKYGSQLKLVQGDITQLNLDQKFDAVISMFAVMGYMTTNQMMASALQTFAKHLKSQSIGVFDLWFGPAVILDPPKEVTKSVETKNGKITRQTKPVLDVISQTVEVNFHTTHTNNLGKRSVNKESHLMRFFFYQELAYYIKQAGLELIAMHPFLSLTGKPNLKNWNMSVILRKL